MIHPLVLGGGFALFVVLFVIGSRLGDIRDELRTIRRIEEKAAKRYLGEL